MPGQLLSLLHGCGARIGVHVAPAIQLMQLNTHYVCVYCSEGTSGAKMQIRWPATLAFAPCAPIRASDKWKYRNN